MTDLSNSSSSASAHRPMVARVGREKQRKSCFLVLLLLLILYIYFHAPRELKNKIKMNMISGSN